jgi:hypothetical protein
VTNSVNVCVFLNLNPRPCQYTLISVQVFRNAATNNTGFDNELHWYFDFILCSVLLAFYIQWNLGCRTNRFPNIKPKQKTHWFPKRILVPGQANLLLTPSTLLFTDKVKLNFCLYFIYLLCLLFLFKILCIFIVFVYDFMHEVLL